MTHTSTDVHGAQAPPQIVPQISAHRYLRSELCTRPRWVAQIHEAESRERVKLIPGGGWCCQGCSTRTRRLWAEHLEHRAGDRDLWEGEMSAEKLARTLKSMRNSALRKHEGMPDYAAFLRALPDLASEASEPDESSYQIGLAGPHADNLTHPPGELEQDGSGPPPSPSSGLGLRYHVIMTAPFLGSVLVEDPRKSFLAALDGVPQVVSGTTRRIRTSRAWSMPERERLGWTTVAVGTADKDVVAAVQAAPDTVLEVSKGAIYLKPGCLARIWAAMDVSTTFTAQGWEHLADAPSLRLAAAA